jgi:hypothetical protein
LVIELNKFRRKLKRKTICKKNVPVALFLKRLRTPFGKET